MKYENIYESKLPANLSKSLLVNLYLYLVSFISISPNFKMFRKRYWLIKLLLNFQQLVITNYNAQQFFESAVYKVKTNLIFLR